VRRATDGGAARHPQHDSTVKARHRGDDNSYSFPCVTDRGVESHALTLFGSTVQLPMISKQCQRSLR
jgi:hypothetical protein